MFYGYFKKTKKGSPPTLDPIPRADTSRDQSIKPSSSRQAQHCGCNHYFFTNGIPFELSPKFSTADSLEITRIQVDDILNLITSTREEVAKLNYDFKLERSVLQKN